MGRVSMRYAKPSDAQKIWQLIRELAEYEGHRDAVKVTPEILRAQMAGENGFPPFECLIVEDGDEAIGFALFHPNYSTWTGKPGLWVEDFYLRPPYRRQGLGRKIFEELFLTAASRNYGRMEWRTLNWNEPMIHFARSLDAVPLDSWTTWQLTEETMRSLLVKCGRKG